jgi:hypothetical protein
MMGSQTRDSFSSLLKLLENGLARNFGDFTVDECLIETLLPEVNITKD